MVLKEVMIWRIKMGVCVCERVSVFVCEKDRETEGRKETVACKREQAIVIYTF